MLYSSQKVGLIISMERINRRMTQEQLSELAGISRSHLAAIEGGKKGPNLVTFWGIAIALSLKPSQLLSKVESY